MTPTSLIIVADRGGLKAYRVDETPNRGASLQLVQSIEITGSHLTTREQTTDQPGKFPMSGGSGFHASSVAERTGLELENDKRTLKQLAGHITEIIEKEEPQGWSFAAPASIHAAIAEQLPGPIQDLIVEHVKSDLLKTEPAKLSSHFRSLQPL